MCINKYLKGKENYFYGVARIVLGLLFVQHGLQKLFGFFGGKGVTLVSLMGLAGAIEFLAGLALILGLWTRLAALVAGGEMLVAYFMGHASKGWAPITNGGELALLFFVGFLIVLVHGAKIWSLEKVLSGEEKF